MIQLHVQYAVEAADLPSEAVLKRWVEQVMAGRQQQAELTIRVVGREEGEQLNHDFRGKDYATNVLSFPFEAPPEIDEAYMGDLAICAEVVAEESQAQGKALEAHWAHMVIHGVLHLLGYDHVDEQQAQVMESIEIQLLSALGYADPYNL